jgi:hypothetical protein
VEPKTTGEKKFPVKSEVFCEMIQVLFCSSLTVNVLLVLEGYLVSAKQ